MWDQIRRRLAHWLQAPEERGKEDRTSGEAMPEGGWGVPVEPRESWHDGWSPIRRRRPEEIEEAPV